MLAPADAVPAGGARPLASAAMEPEIRNDAAAQRYVATLDGREAGYAAYLRSRGRIVLMHTEVDEALEGHGVGGALARFALDEARSEGREVIPVCPFMRGWSERHPDYAELVPADQRERFGLPG